MVFQKSIYLLKWPQLQLRLQSAQLRLQPHLR
jgi:hypothetical protein